MRGNSPRHLSLHRYLPILLGEELMTISVPPPSPPKHAEAQRRPIDSGRRISRPHASLVPARLHTEEQLLTHGPVPQNRIHIPPVHWFRVSFGSSPRHVGTPVSTRGHCHQIVPFNKTIRKGLQKGLPLREILCTGQTHLTKPKQHKSTHHQKGDPPP